jgi:hypothetical protein
MDLSTAISLLAVVAAIGSAMLARRDLLTKLDERDTARNEWRREITADVEALKRATPVTELALLTQSVQTLALSVKDLWKYTTDLKHMHVDPYLLEVAKLRASVDRLEDK